MRQKYEDALSLTESQLVDVKNMLEHQEAETRKADSKFKSSLDENEKLRAGFSMERAAWEDEKAALLQRTEATESYLKETTSELIGLKCHISQMTSAIFGPRSSNLGQDMLLKLKAVYTLMKQLYTGTQQTLVAISNGKQSPNLLRKVLDKLSVMPQKLEEIKQSAARAGAITALTQAIAWQVELDPEEMATGCPTLKEDGSPFDQTDFAKCVKEMRPLACKLAEEADLSRYQSTYTMENAKVKAPAYDVVDLTPPMRKHTFAPDVDSSPIMNDEVVFEALTSIDWTSPDLHIGEEEEPKQDDPESSTRRDEGH